MALRKPIAVGSALTVLGLLAGCSTSTPPSPPAPTTSTAPATRTFPSLRERDARIQEQLPALGCSSNGCIQTYFGCLDGYITGDPCDFYRKHPLS